MMSAQSRDARNATRDSTGSFVFGRIPRLESRFSSRGVTLVELVISITVIAIAVAAVLGVLSMLSTGSAEAMIRNQAVAIANAYLEEIRLKDFASNGVPGSRSLYDDVSDYNGLVDVGARDQFGNTIVGLEQYTVSVTVGAGTLGGVPGASVRRIDVNVQHSIGVNMTLSGYRAAL
jgi:MSHA pilin protein MshD